MRVRKRSIQLKEHSILEKQVDRIFEIPTDLIHMNGLANLCGQELHTCSNMIWVEVCVVTNCIPVLA